METSLIEYIIGGVLLIIALVLITIIMLQQSKKKGLSGAISGSSSNESYFGKNRAKTKERFYSKLTAILGTIFVFLVLTLYIVHAKRVDKENEEASNISSTVSDVVSAEESAQTSEIEESSQAEASEEAEDVSSEE